MSDLSPTIPASFIERFVWKPDSIAIRKNPFNWSFDGDMLSEAQASISCAFRAPNTDISIGKSVTLLSPYHGGNAVIDAVIENIAMQENADVLVLDSLELIAGRAGALGPGGGSLVDAIYSRLPIEQFTD
ncbi:hypothetical protein V5O48_019336, partial [Marasmius crinis-equi]